MSSVDSRIVTMKFDNTGFERGVASTLSTLSKLKSALAFGGADKGLSSLKGVGAGVNLQPLEDSVHRVSAGFIALSTVAITAISNIANRAVNAGLTLAKSLTIQPILDGYHEYETNLNSIQTILANTGLEGDKGLAKVNGALNELNHYSDKTIYNFSEMARNIGTFTAAGVDLDTSTAAIKGIANLAAVSGSNSNQASTAMYQLSQALAAGRVSLMDWNSVVNAGMGGKLFQNQLMDTARIHGVAIDKMVKDEGGFRNTLQNGWLTSDILTETLSKFTGDLTRNQIKAMGYTNKQATEILKLGKTATDAATKVKTMSQLLGTLQEAVGSGWSRSFQLIFGDFNQAKTLFTNVNNVLGGMIQNSAKARNKVLGDWNKLGGRDMLIKGIANAFHALMAILKPVHDAFRDIFPAATGKDLYNLTVMFTHFTKSLIIGKDTAAALGDTFRGVFAILSIAGSIVFNIARYFLDLIPLLFGGAGGFLDLTGGVGQFLTQLQKMLVQGGLIHNFFQFFIDGREKVLGPLIEIIGHLVGALAGLITPGLLAFADWLGSLGKYADEVNAVIDAVRGFLEIKIDQGVAYLKSYGDELQALGDKVRALASAGWDKIVQFFNFIKPYVTDVAKLGAALAYLAGTGAVKFVQLFGAGIKNLGPVLATVGDAIQKAFGSLSGIAGGIGKVDLGSIFSFGPGADAAVAGAKKVGDAVGGTAAIADRVKAAWQGVVNAFKNVGQFMAPAVGVIKDMFGSIGDKIKNFVSGMGIEDALALVNTGFFIAFYSTVRSFTKKLSGLVDESSKTMAQLGEMFGGVTDNLKAMQQDVKAGAIMKIAAALLILAVALLILSKIPVAKLAVSLTAVGVLMFALSKLMGTLEGEIGPDNMKEAITGAARLVIISSALVLLGLAILALSLAVKMLGSMSIGDLAKGLGSVAILLGIIIGATKLLEKSGGGKEIVLASIAIGILAVALTAFAGALELYAALDTGTLAEGTAKMVAAMFAINFAMRGMPKNTLEGAASLIIVSAAMVVLAGALQVLASMSGGDSLQAILTLGTTLLILSIGIRSMSDTYIGAAALLVVAAALAVLGPALALIGNLPIQVIALALLTLIATMAILGAAAALLGPVVPVMDALAGAIALLGLAALAAGAGMFLFAAGLATLAASGAAGVAVLIGAIVSLSEIFPLVMHQFGLGMLALAKVIATAGPALVRAFSAVLHSFITAVIQNTPGLARMLQTMILHGLAVIRAVFPSIVQTGIQILLNLLNGIRRNITQIANVSTDIIVKFLNAISKNLPRIIEAGVNLLIKFISGITKAVNTHSGELGAQGLKLAEALVHGMVNGITNMAGQVMDAAAALASRAVSAIKDKLSIFSPSKVTHKLGEFVGQGLANGIAASGKGVTDSAGELADGALSVMQMTMSKLKDAVENDMDMTPVIAPVLDLAALQAGAPKIGAMLDGQTVTAGVSLGRASSISADKLAARAADSTLGDSTSGAAVQFVQNNTSPKALTPSEIYRNTKNLLSLKEEALKREHH